MPNIDDVIAALAPWRAQHTRSAWKPIISRFPGRDERTHFGGGAHLAPGDAWPRCGGCHSEMPLFVQLDLATLPMTVAPGRGLLQLFYCTSEGCAMDLDPWAAFSKAHVVRIVDGALESKTSAAAVPQKTITGWERVDDLPRGDERREQGMVVDYDFTAKTARVRCGDVDVAGLSIDDSDRLFDGCVDGDKLGGWPYWIQGVEYPQCPVCGQRMGHVFQVDSEDNVDHMFGDVGTGHITQCAAHPHVLAFAWACS